MKRTCAEIVKLETDAHLTDLITFGHLGELLDRSVNESNWDPKHPCAAAKPPIEHSHGFWADGTFNSYDENGEEVDAATYVVNGDSVTISNPDFGTWTFVYHVSANTLVLNALMPSDCVSKKCRDGLGWAFGVSWGGQPWTQVISIPPAPPKG